MKYCLKVGVLMLIILSAFNQNTSEKKVAAGTPDAVDDMDILLKEENNGKTHL